MKRIRTLSLMLIICFSCMAHLAVHATSIIGKNQSRQDPAIKQIHKFKTKTGESLGVLYGRKFPGKDDFFDYQNAGANFEYNSVRPGYTFEDSNFLFTFQDNPSEEFDCVRKYFPGNPSSLQNSEVDGIKTTDIYGNPLSHPYGIRIYGTTGNVGTLYFSSKSTWESWWDYMRAPYLSGNCND